jgi:hypothetical protein
MLRVGRRGEGVVRLGCVVFSFLGMRVEDLYTSLEVMGKGRSG